MHIVTGFKELKKIKNSLWAQKTFFWTSASKNSIPKSVKKCQTYKYVSIRRSDIRVFKVSYENVNSIFLSEKFFILLASVTKISYDSQTEFFYFYRILLSLKELQ